MVQISVGDLDQDYLGGNTAKRGRIEHDASALDAGAAVRFLFSLGRRLMLVYPVPQQDCDRGQ